MLAPITAALMAEAIVTGRTPELLGPFLPDRLRLPTPRAAPRDG